MAGEQEGGITLDAAMSRMSLTWLRASSGPAAVGAPAGTIEGILEELAELGLAARRRDGEGRLAYGLTDLGGRFCRSPLPALPAARAVQGLKRLRKMVGEYAAQFYLEALRAAWSVAERGPDQPLRGASGSAPDPRLLARYGWQGRAGAGPAGEGEAGPHLALRHYAFAAAGMGSGMPASRAVAAGMTAVDTARVLLELADLAGGRSDRGEGISEGLAYIATRCMLNFLEGGAGLLERCTAETERGRAAFLIECLSGRPAGPRWLAPPARAGAARPRRFPLRRCRTWRGIVGARAALLCRQCRAGGWRARLAPRHGRRPVDRRPGRLGPRCAGGHPQAHFCHACTDG